MHDLDPEIDAGLCVHKCCFTVLIPMRRKDALELVPVDRDSAALVGKEYCDFAKWIVSTGAVILGLFGATFVSKKPALLGLGAVLGLILYIYLVIVAATLMTSMPELLIAKDDEARARALRDMRGEMRTVAYLFAAMVLVVIAAASLIGFF